MKVDKTLVASVALHVLVIGWGLVSFSSRAFEAVPEETLPVDIISADQLSKITAGAKTGKKEDTNQRVDKIADANPIEDTVGKISPKPPIVTDAAPEVQEKPAEKQPTPPKPVADEKPKPDKTKEESKIDPIGDLARKDQAKKPTPKPQAAAKPSPPQHQPEKKERKYDELAIARLITQQDPTRQAATGSALNASNQLGASNRSDAENSAGWKSALKRRIHECFNFPYNGADKDTFEVDIDIQFKPDGTLAAQPVIQGVRGASAGIGKAMADNAARAVIQCQPYTFLPKEQYAAWKFVGFGFDLRDSY